MTSRGPRNSMQGQNLQVHKYERRCCFESWVLSLIFCDHGNDDDDDDDSVTDLSTYMGVMVLPGRRYQHLKNHW